MLIPAPLSCVSQLGYGLDKADEPIRAQWWYPAYFRCASASFFPIFTDNVLLEGFGGLFFFGTFSDERLREADGLCPRGTLLFRGCAVLAASSSVLVASCFVFLSGRVVGGPDRKCRGSVSVAVVCGTLLA